MWRLTGCLDENTVVAFAEGRVAPGELARVDDHVAECAQCQRLVAAALELRTHGRATGTTPSRAVGLALDAERGRLRRGATLGRYTILGMAGHGAMGEVYAAYDGELDRKVAFKVLRADRGDDIAHGRARLLREARALARLSHPHVVAVHDIGTFDDRVFVAMDFVDGQTLKDWLAEHPRGQRDILDAFMMAARGLAAAHAAGLVHRDFKPGNVMIARNGAVRVLDFGLASRPGDDTAEAGPDSVSLAVAATAAVTLTATGELVGTPRYMAPEQMRAAATDARTDQFSFCVALYEALYGELPFGGTTLLERMPEVLAGHVRPPPAKTQVPARLRRVLLRGLSVAPEARWPSMNALVSALAHDPAITRRRWSMVAGAMALATVSIANLVGSSTRPASLCLGGPSRLEAVWEPAGRMGAAPRREAGRRAFLASGAPGASDTWERVAPVLDRYVADWLSMYTDTCEATHLRHQQAESLLDLRMSCLDERRTALAALTDVLVTADRGVVTKAVDAVNALPALDRCSNVDLLRAPVEPPGPAVARRVAEARRRAAIAKALNDTGRHQEGLKQVKALIDEAREIGYLPLLAELLESRARIQGGANFLPEAVPVAEEAVWVGVASGRDDVAADAANGLVAFDGYYRARPADGWYWSKLGRALLTRLPGKQERAYAWLLQNEALVHSIEDRPRLMLEKAMESVAMKKSVLGPEHADVAVGLNSVADAWHRLGNDAAALPINAEALQIFSKAYGLATTETCMTLGNRGEYMVGLRQAAEAVSILGKATACWERQVGPRHRFVAYPLTALGHALSDLGRASEAIAPLERALGIREAAEPDAALVAETRDALAKARHAAHVRQEPAPQRPAARPPT